MGSVFDRILRKVKGNMAFEIWSNLLKKFEERNRQGMDFLIRKYINVKQEKSESVESSINILIRIKEEVDAAVSAVSDEDTDTT